MKCKLLTGGLDTLLNPFELYFPFDKMRIIISAQLIFLRVYTYYFIDIDIWTLHIYQSVYLCLYFRYYRVPFKELYLLTCSLIPDMFYFPSFMQRENICWGMMYQGLCKVFGTEM